MVGVFESRNQAELALAELHKAGFGANDLGFVIRGEDAVAVGAITDAPLTKDGQGAATGMLAGGVAGGLLGAAAVLVIPGVGPLLAMGVRRVLALRPPTASESAQNSLDVSSKSRLHVSRTVHTSREQNRS